jgi:poly(3-hydroxybutyrate) depolymerase
LSETGYLYLPKDCEPGGPTPCRLHIVLHGCTQSSEALGDEFYTKIGVNEWADANRIIVLYPQAHATTVAELPAQAGMTAIVDANPYGCWNWWGYAEDPQYLTKNGVQVSAIWAMVRRIGGQ